ncbi:MAG: ATP-binding cassette domain-containing protein [Actinobacteria bacterium]|nr:ATP-binding cassette domain-containing protein [Actinomycetota bacterium]
MSDSAIHAEGLQKRFGSVRALDGLDLDVPAGTIFGLLGPNGAGKTTAVRVFTTILHPDGGTARVLGHDVAKEPDLVRTLIGLAGQYAAVDENLTGRENLRMVGRLTHLAKPAINPRADELLERFSLTDAANRPVKTYSGGMRRRLDLSAALVHRPPVLFLDEPTTGLDVTSRTELWNVIRELQADGTSVLLTTQYLEEADQLASTIAVVDHGKVIALGSPAELKATIGSTVLSLTFASKAATTRAVRALTKASGSAPKVDGTAVEVTLQKGTKEVVGLLRALDTAKATPATLAVRESSLDDVFLSLTGHKAEEDVA